MHFSIANRPDCDELDIRVAASPRSAQGSPATRRCSDGQAYFTHFVICRKALQTRGALTSRTVKHAVASEHAQPLYSLYQSDTKTSRKSPSGAFFSCRKTHHHATFCFFPAARASWLAVAARFP